MRFRVVRELGRGATGVVSLVHDEQSGGAYALKRLATPMVEGDAFSRELMVSTTLVHPNIVRVFEAGTDELGAYLLLELVDGLSLQRAVERARDHQLSVPLTVTCAVALGVARALEAAHGVNAGAVTGILHRDVSLANVLLSRSGEVKLTDFGVARLLGVTPATGQGIVKGALGALAPELLEGAQPSPASDVFSLGVLLFRLVTGVAPFQGRTNDEVVQALRFGTAPSSTTLAPQAPAWLTGWVDAALARAPTARPTLGALLEALEQRPPLISDATQSVRAFIAAVGAVTSAPVRPHTKSLEPAAPAPDRSWVWVVALGLAAAAATQFVSPLGCQPTPEEPDASMNQEGAAHGEP